MKKIFDDIYQTEKQSPFAGMQAYAYYLSTTNAKVLLYNGGNKSDLAFMEEKGGVGFQMLSHRDEIGENLLDMKTRFDCKITCHEKTRDLVEKIVAVDEAITERKLHSTNIEIIPTPGHTDGCISFLYHSPAGNSYLFTGDLISMSSQGWETFIFPGRGASRADVLTSMQIYRQLSPDIVVPSGSAEGSPSYFQFTPEEWVDSIDNYIARLERELGVK